MVAGSRSNYAISHTRPDVYMLMGVPSSSPSGVICVHFNPPVCNSTGRYHILTHDVSPRYRVRDSAVDDDTNSNGRSPKHMNVASRQQLFYHQQNSPRHHTHPDFASPGRGSTVGDVSTFATNVSNFSSPPAVDTLEATVARMERYGGSPLTRPSSQCASPSKAPDVGLQTHGPIEGLHVPIDAVVLSSTPTDPSTIPSLRRSNSGA